MDFLISFFIGLAAYGVFFFAFFKALKQADRIDTFIGSKLKMPWLAAQLWWLFPLLFLVAVVNLVQTIVTFIDPSIAF
jgi:hypothetical protein